MVVALLARSFEEGLVFLLTACGVVAVLCFELLRSSFLVFIDPLIARWSFVWRVNDKISRKRSLQNGLAEAGGALEVGVHDGFQFLHHA